MDNLSWARTVVGRYIIHIESNVIGKVVKCWDGETEIWPSVAGMPVPVVELDNRHAFIANPVHFVVLTNDEAMLFNAGSTMVDHVAMSYVKLSGESGVKFPQAVKIYVAILRNQLAAFSADTA